MPGILPLPRGVAMVDVEDGGSLPQVYCGRCIIVNLSATRTGQGRWQRRTKHQLRARLCRVRLGRVRQPAQCL